MAKRHSTKPIPPFPSDIDRDAFGHWLSGFTDGEGCFMLYLQNTKGRRLPKPSVCFQIELRADDSEILYKIRAFWQCGRVNQKPERATAKPHTVFRVSAAAALWGIVVPHFSRYRLYAKKARDFSVWKRGVELSHMVNLRPIRGFGYGGGTYPKWTAGERKEFSDLVRVLGGLREFEAPEEPMPTKRDEEFLLFD